jgi:hypothetical protein
LWFGRSADVEGRISMQADIVADLDRRIHQIDAAIETATQRGRTNAAMQLAADQRRNRAELAAHRDQVNKVLADLKIEKAKVDGDKRVAGAALGPVRYLAPRRRRSGCPSLVYPGRRGAVGSCCSAPPSGRHPRR